MKQLTLESLIRKLIYCVIVLRMTISAGMLNNLVGYTSGQGALLGRIHPATYLLVLPTLLFIWRGRIRPFPAIDIAVVLSIFAAIIAARNGGLNTACVIVDTGIGSLLIARMLIHFGPAMQQRALIAMIAIALLNLGLVGLESYMGQAIIPRDRIELFFRPQGIFDHPLFAGYICCFLMWAVLRSQFRPSVALIVSIGLWLEVILVAVRLPMLLASGVLIFQIVAIGRGGMAKVGMSLVAVIVVPLLIAAAATVGWLDRVLTIGLFDDESAGSRLSVFDIFSRMSQEQILFGMDQESIDAARTVLKMQAIESSFVLYTVTAGIFVAILAYVANIVAALPVIRRDWIFAALFLGMLGGSIALSTKNTTMMVIFAAAATRYDTRGRLVQRQPGTLPEEI